MPVDRFELPEEKQELLGERIKAFNNLAQGQMKIEAWDAALAALGNVLKIEVQCSPLIRSKFRPRTSFNIFKRAGPLSGLPTEK